MIDINNDAAEKAFITRYFGQATGSEMQKELGISKSKYERLVREQRIVQRAAAPCI